MNPSPPFRVNLDCDVIAPNVFTIIPPVAGRVVSEA